MILSIFKSKKQICIWCKQYSPIVTFEQQAHTFPQSLGGANVCENVCDHCNSFFGSTDSKYPGVETVLKEMLNISKFLLLNQSKTLPKNRRFKSTFFNVNWNSMVVKMKPKYKLRQGFQKELGRRFRRGLFMAYLEERERIMGDALSKRFDWIREFARYNAGDYPLYFLVPKFPAVFFSDVDLLKPELRFTRHSIRQEKKFKAHIIPIMGHNFVVPVAKNFDEKYRLKFLKHLQKTDYPLGEVIRKVNYAEDIDYVFSHLHRH